VTGNIVKNKPNENSSLLTQTASWYLHFV